MFRRTCGDFFAYETNHEKTEGFKVSIRQIKTRKCRASRQQLEPSSNPASSACCGDAEYRNANVQWTNNNVGGFGNDEIPETEMNSEKVKKKKTASGRVCRKCGRDPYPNYFYCPACHKKIHLAESDSEETGYEEWE